MQNTLSTTRNYKPTIEQTQTNKRLKHIARKPKATAPRPTQPLQQPKPELRPNLEPPKPEQPQKPQPNPEPNPDVIEEVKDELGNVMIPKIEIEENESKKIKNKGLAANFTCNMKIYYPGDNQTELEGYFEDNRLFNGKKIR